MWFNAVLFFSTNINQFPVHKPALHPQSKLPGLEISQIKQQTLVFYKTNSPATTTKRYIKGTTAQVKVTFTQGLTWFCKALLLSWNTCYQCFGKTAKICWCIKLLFLSSASILTAEVQITQICRYLMYCQNLVSVSNYIQITHYYTPNFPNSTIFL